jgi:hypothetical protein
MLVDNASSQWGEVRQSITGVAFVANRFIPAGTEILSMRPHPIGSQNNRYAVTRSRDTFWLTENTPPSRLDHSCNANARFRFSDWALIAVKDIQPNERVTFDYNTTEYTLSCPFECLCGESSCYGIIRGYRYLPESRKAELRSLVPDWFIESDHEAPPRACVLLPRNEGPVRESFDRNFEEALREAGFAEIDVFMIGLSKETIPTTVCTEKAL